MSAHSTMRERPLETRIPLTPAIGRFADRLQRDPKDQAPSVRSCWINWSVVVMTREEAE